MVSKEEMYGPWMTVQRQDRGRKGNPVKGNPNDKLSIKEVEEHLHKQVAVDEDNREATLHEGREKRVFLTGSEMRREKGKLVVGDNDNCGSQEYVSVVPEMPKGSMGSTRIRENLHRREESNHGKDLANMERTMGTTNHEIVVDDGNIKEGMEEEIMGGPDKNPKYPDISIMGADQGGGAGPMEEENGPKEALQGEIIEVEMWADPIKGVEAMQA
ncbi:hypothetical protein PIB30_031271 [Stylosanthes scabra]|uniref:Uncharacterized protein n=1 Tax=Stylosanthes scabra TaxID=79078 RepID=A0ABU6YA66_9FABA|nr:hypothetical protein [Stylosanthes scabra]